MLNEHIATQIYAKFAFTPTFGQKKIIESFADWISDDDFERIFVLNGYAGTGKTTLIAACVATLTELKIKPILLAPTGRAAKVLAQHTPGHSAHTIHKRIYRERSSASYESKFDLNQNREKDAVFIIDEASMIANAPNDTGFYGSGQLLDDLIEYVYGGENCRLLLLGDTAQLPPVGQAFSPALSPEVLRSMGMNVISYELNRVARQDTDSGILFNDVR